MKFLATLIVAFLLVLLIYHWDFTPSRSPGINDMTPRQTLIRFLDLCEKGEISNALKYWTPESIENFPELEKWCEELAELDLRFGKAGYGKYKTIVALEARVTSGNDPNGLHQYRRFTFEVRNGNWFLHWYPSGRKVSEKLVSEAISGQVPINNKR